MPVTDAILCEGQAKVAKLSGQKNKGQVAEFCGKARQLETELDILMRGLPLSAYNWRRRSLLLQRLR